PGVPGKGRAGQRTAARRGVEPRRLFEQRRPAGAGPRRSTGVTGRALAAAITPLTEDGGVDDAAFGPYARFLADGGVDGILARGTTGEGVLFAPDERERVAERYLEAAPEGFAVFVHCGAQSTGDT